MAAASSTAESNISAWWFDSYNNNLHAYNCTQKSSTRLSQKQFRSIFNKELFFYYFLYIQTVSLFSVDNNINSTDLLFFIPFALVDWKFKIYLIRRVLYYTLGFKWGINLILIRYRILTVRNYWFILVCTRVFGYYICARGINIYSPSSLLLLTKVQKYFSRCN